MLGFTSDGDDVVQDTLVTAWQQLPALRDRSRARPWLLQITSRNALDLIRSRKPHDDIAPGPQAAAALHAAIRQTRAENDLPVRHTRIRISSID